MKFILLLFIIQITNIKTPVPKIIINSKKNTNTNKDAKNSSQTNNDINEKMKLLKTLVQQIILIKKEKLIKMLKILA